MYHGCKLRSRKENLPQKLFKICSAQNTFWNLKTSPRRTLKIDARDLDAEFKSRHHNYFKILSTKFKPYWYAPRTEALRLKI